MAQSVSEKIGNSELFQLFIADMMDAYPVANDFLKMRSYDEAIIKPAE